MPLERVAPLPYGLRGVTLPMRPYSSAHAGDALDRATYAFVAQLALQPLM